MDEEQEPRWSPRGPEYWLTRPVAERRAEAERLRAEHYSYDINDPPPMERVFRLYHRELPKDDDKDCPPAP